MEYKIVISDPKTGKSYQRDIKEKEADVLEGKKLGESVNGDNIGFSGYEFLITGGSDRAGFPMRKDVLGTGRKKVLAVAGVGIKKGRKGMRVRKTVSGNIIGNETVQINLKITKYGKEKFEKPEEPAATS